MTVVANHERLPAAAADSITGRLSTIDRLLPLQIFVAMALGILLGRVYPGLGATLDRVQVAGVSVPIAVGLLWMMYPVLAKVRYETIGRHARDTRLLGTSLILNGVVGPLIEVPALVGPVYASLWARRQFFPQSTNASVSAVRTI